ncbi:MAG: 4Fe-4S binding protein [Breznakibacter sp.]
MTEQYPENRATLKMFERFKGEVTMPHTADNYHRCTGCGICETNCPNGSIQVLTRKETGEDGKSVRVLDRHIYHLSMCTFCGLCVKTCPSDALAFAQTFEHAVFDRQKLTKVLNKEGSSLKKEQKQHEPA